ncbi:hypothetical protein ACFL16_03100 [Patescibacteria group bacterium]
MKTILSAVMLVMALLVSSAHALENGEIFILPQDSQVHPYDIGGCQDIVMSYYVGSIPITDQTEKIVFERYENGSWVFYDEDTLADAEMHPDPPYNREMFVSISAEGIFCEQLSWYGDDGQDTFRVIVINQSNDPCSQLVVDKQEVPDFRSGEYLDATGNIQYEVLVDGIPAVEISYDAESEGEKWWESVDRKVARLKTSEDELCGVDNLILTLNARKLERIEEENGPFTFRWRVAQPVR